MKNFYTLISILFLGALSYGQAVFINEIHYDNTGTDVDEAIEIAGPAGTDLSSYSLVLYNGNNGGEYNTTALSGVITDQDDGYGTINFLYPENGIQNGAPDGIVLFDGTSVVQFLSYEGSFDAVGGVADGMTSTDIGVAEIGVDVGYSLQLGGSGTEYSNFTWQEAMANTYGAVNTNQDFGGTPMPDLTIVYPYDGAFLNPEMTDIEVTFNVVNFVVANGTGDGYIQYGVDGSGPDNHYSTDPISITGLSSGSHTLFMQLVDNSGNPLSPAVDDTVNFEIAAYTDVANLAALRAGTVGEYYRVTGEVYGTFGQDYRNQKWCQDTTGGIMIDDNDGIITTVYNEGDGVVNLRGKLNFYNVLQLIPTADPGVNSTGHIITPEVITLADLASSKTLADYESELVQINGVSISDYDDGGAGTADGTFQTGQNYPIDDGTATSSLRTNFHDADYIGTALPSEPMTYVCIVGAHNDIAQVTPRDLDDILSINNLPQIAGFELYPNPVTDGVIHINTANNEAKDISIYNLVGKLVYQKNTSAFSISIDQLDAGIYMIQVVEARHVATRKLLVK